MKNKNLEIFSGVGLFVLVLFFGYNALDSGMLFFRLIAGLALGYTLSRAYMGFAGGVNRAYIHGSTKLMRSLMYMFFITSIVTAGFLMFKDEIGLNLWVNPINMGLIVGGLLFGFGMTFSTCCASGVLTDLASEMPKAFITLLFFGMGVFVGFPIQSTASWVRKTWISTSSFADKGVYFPDLFSGGKLGGYLGAVVLTGILAGIVTYLSLQYEKKRKKAGTYSQPSSEVAQEELTEINLSNFDFFSDAGFNKIFVEPWSIKKGIFVIIIVFTLLLAVTGSGWGASTPYGFWFGKLLMVFGFSAESLAAFSLKPAKVYSMPFFAHPINVQNFGIIMGATVYLLMSSQFVLSLKASLKLKAFQIALFAMGGFTMGLGTRLSNGCNVGALYTPIASFSLSGWIYLLLLVIGGTAGNILQKKIYDKMS